MAGTGIRTHARARRAPIAGAAIALFAIALLAGSGRVAAARSFADPEVWIGSPFAGNWAQSDGCPAAYPSEACSEPQYHHVTYSGYDGTPEGQSWATDVYPAKGAGTPVVLYAAPQDPATAVTTKVRVANACRSGGTAAGGSVVVVDVYANGARIGYVAYAHLTPAVTNGATVNRWGTVLGYVGAYASNGCWTGVHTHLELGNVHNYSCFNGGFRPARGVGQAMQATNFIGFVGGARTSGPRQPCPPAAAEKSGGSSGGNGLQGGGNPQQPGGNVQQGGSNPQSPALDTSAPTIPSGLSTSAVGATSVTLSWSPSTDNVGVSGYSVLLDNAEIGTVTGTSYGFGGLACGSTHKLGVVAFDAAGNKSNQGSISATTQACSSSQQPQQQQQQPARDTTAPSVPTALQQTDNSQTAVRLAWNGSTDNVGVSGYDVYVNGAKVASVASTGYVAGGLACGTTYEFAVDAYDAAGNVSGRAGANGSTQSCPPALPTFTVMNTSESPPDGVYFRNSPHTSDTGRVTGLGVYAGERVQLLCYAFGDSVGPFADRLWYRVNNVSRPTVNGQADSGWLNAHYINDGKAANDVDAGVPAC